MNKKLFSLLMVILIASPSSYAVFAEDDVYSSESSEVESIDNNDNEEDDVSRKSLLKNRQEKISERIENREVKMEELQEKRAEIAEKKCEDAQNRIQNKTMQMQNNLNMYSRVQSRTSERLVRLSSLLASKGLDVSTLNNQIATLSTMSLELKTTYAGLITNMNGAQEVTCNETKEAFKNRFELAKDDVEQIKQVRSEIKNYINSTIKPELQRLRQQIIDEREVSETDSNEDNDVDETPAIIN